MASRYYYGAILAATLATSSSSAVDDFAPAVEVERELHGNGHHGGWTGGWDNDGWSAGSSSSSSSSGKSGKSGGGKSGKSGGGSSGKSGKSGYSGSSGDSVSGDHHGGDHHWGAPPNSHGGWGKPPSWHGGWPAESSSSSSSSSSGKSGKSGGGKSGKSGGYSSSSSSSSSSSHDGHGGWHGGWGKPPSSWHGGWPAKTDSSSSSSSSSSGKSGKSGGSKGGKSGYSSSSSSSSSEDHHGHWTWVVGPGGPPSHGGWGGPGGWDSDGWSGSDSISSSSSSGKSGKSGGSGSGKSGKSGGSSDGSTSDSGSEDVDTCDVGATCSKEGSRCTVGTETCCGETFDSLVCDCAKDGDSLKYMCFNTDACFAPSCEKTDDESGWNTDGWSGPSSIGSSSSSSSSSGKSGKSGGSGSGKSGKSGGSSSSTSVEDDDDDAGDWNGDGWDGDGYVVPIDIYSHGGYAAGWNADGWDNDGHYKADIDYVRSHVTKLIKDSKRELIPKFLRLGFHDCVGGCDGCVDLTNPDNKGLEEPIKAIYPIVEKFKDSYSRADIWALATLVSADLAVMNGRPHGLHFPMRYIGRKDCGGDVNLKGIGGPDVEMPSNDFTTHELLDFFEKYFDFDADETVTIMGVHAVAVMHPDNLGFGNKGKEDGWVFDAESYKLDNRYYGMLVGDEEDPVYSAPMWHMELVHNDNGIPSRYQWYTEKDGEDERPIMTNADMALVRDLKDHMTVDEDGNEGAVTCAFKDEGKPEGYTRRTRSLNSVACPVASKTIEKMVEYKMDNEHFLYDFEKVLEKMVKNGY